MKFNFCSEEACSQEGGPTSPKIFSQSFAPKPNVLFASKGEGGFCKGELCQVQLSVHDLRFIFGKPFETFKMAANLLQSPKQMSPELIHTGTIFF